MGIKNVNKVQFSIRLEKPIADAVKTRARGLLTTPTWVIASALREFLKDDIPPDFVLGMPTLEDDDE